MMFYVLRSLVRIKHGVNRTRPPNVLIYGGFWLRLGRLCD